MQMPVIKSQGWCEEQAFWLTCFFNAGPDDVKMIMVKMLAEMESTDHNKEILFDSGILPPLLRLVSHNDVEMKLVAFKALQNLSTLKKNGLEMIRQGAARKLFGILFQHSLPSSRLSEHVAPIIMQLAASTISQDTQTPVSLLESDEDVINLFSLASYTVPDVRQYIIQTFYSLCHSPSASYIRNKLREVCI